MRRLVRAVERMIPELGRNAQALKPSQAPNHADTRDFHDEPARPASYNREVLASPDHTLDVWGDGQGEQVVVMTGQLDDQDRFDAI